MQLKTEQANKNTQVHTRQNKPGKFRLRGGELAAEDCLLEGIQGDKGIIGLGLGLGFGDVAPDAILGDTAVE